MNTKITPFYNTGIEKSWSNESMESENIENLNHGYTESWKSYNTGLQESLRRAFKKTRVGRDDDFDAQIPDSWYSEKGKS